MDPEQQPIDKARAKTYPPTWNQFIDRAMQILVDEPIDSRCTIKFMPRKNIFVVKVTDGQSIIMRRVNANTEFEQIQKFTQLVTRALTNEVEQQKIMKDVEKEKKKKNKKNNKKK